MTLLGMSAHDKLESVYDVNEQLRSVDASGHYKKKIEADGKLKIA